MKQTEILKLALTDDMTAIRSLICQSANGTRELLGVEQKPLYLLRARTRQGETVLFSPAEAEISKQNNTLLFRHPEVTVKVTIQTDAENIRWSFALENRSDLALEFIDLPNISFGGKLRENGGDCAIVSAYNEGALIENSDRKTYLTDPEYPSRGTYMMYPYMVFAPISMWLFGKEGLLMSVLDEKLSPKGLDFQCSPESTRFRTRLFLGGNYGTDIDNGIEIVWTYFTGDWQKGAEIYREYVYKHTYLEPISKANLPDWYTNDMPLVITYPVRGIHDMDEMKPNKLFPYENVLPLVDEFAKKTGAKIMVLLMHWEGTAPWAPPYVYPPFGGEEMFRDFMNKLHERGDLLGVYCSGLSMTEQSNLIESYNLSDKIISERLNEGFSKAPDQTINKSKICEGQRSGYDICAASEMGKKTLNEALAPLLESGVDYVQALDQNHGGGMYFCYANDHGHAPMPGSWMTDTSRELLQGWRKLAPNTLLGCESAAAEPYINELRLSDNRYELCYIIGKAIPLYSFIYHKYLHNFMGNQICCYLENTTRSVLYRIAYSFAAGDMITFVINEDGKIMFSWGVRDFSVLPDRETVISFCRELHRVHKAYPTLFRDAEMRVPFDYTCEMIEMGSYKDSILREKAVLSSAWNVDGKIVQLFVNFTDKPQTVTLASTDGLLNLQSNTFTVEAANAVALEYEVK